MREEMRAEEKEHVLDDEQRHILYERVACKSGEILRAPGSRAPPDEKDWAGSIPIPCRAPSSRVVAVWWCQGKAVLLGCPSWVPSSAGDV